MAATPLIISDFLHNYKNVINIHSIRRSTWKPSVAPEPGSRTRAVRPGTRDAPFNMGIAGAVVLTHPTNSAHYALPHNEV